jgi:hypothetical protein
MEKNVDEKTLLDTSVRIENLIFQIRGLKEMLDYNLAELYGVPTKALKQAVRRNQERFPSDFMFELSQKEFTNLKSQIVTSSSPQWGGRRYRPMAFTEQGVAMVSSVLRSKRAVQVNIEIMRAFVRLRKILATHKDLERKIAELEGKYDEQFKVVFEALHQLMSPPETKSAQVSRDKYAPIVWLRAPKPPGTDIFP